MANIMTVRPPEKLHQHLKSEAKKRGYTMNQLILTILWEWVSKNEKNTHREDECN